MQSHCTCKAAPIFLRLPLLPDATETSHTWPDVMQSGCTRGRAHLHVNARCQVSWQIPCCSLEAEDPPVDLYSARGRLPAGRGSPLSLSSRGLQQW